MTQGRSAKDGNEVHGDSKVISHAIKETKEN